MNAVGPVALLVLCWLVSCTYYVARGSDLYHQGRYIEAAHVFEKTESRLSEAEPAERAAYGLYRGATLLRLGDLGGAERWLGYARLTDIEYPQALSHQQRQLLQETLILLDGDQQRQRSPD